MREILYMEREWNKMKEIEKISVRALLKKTQTEQLELTWMMITYYIILFYGPTSYLLRTKAVQSVLPIIWCDTQLIDRKKSCFSQF
jgi:hypothetical protein